jgi:hypothetical protein
MRAKMSPYVTFGDADRSVHGSQRDRRAEPGAARNAEFNDAKDPMIGIIA